MSTNKAKLEALLGLINSAAEQAIAEYEKEGGDVPSIDSTQPHPLDKAVDTISLKNAIRTLEGASAQLCATLAPPLHTAVKLVNANDRACFRIALRERITDVLAGYPKGIRVDELSKIIRIDAKKLARVMRLLATRGFYNEVEADTFANNRLSLILHSNTPEHCLVGIETEVNDKGAAVLYETLKDPRTAYSDDPKHAPNTYAACIKESTCYDLLEQEDAERESFHNAMRALNNSMGSLAFLNQFPFEKYSTVVDVGGGVGAFSLPLARTHKHISITLQDLPEALIQARNYWTTEYPEVIQENRIEFSDINFFTQVPAKGKDIYYLRAVLHNWSDHEATLILRNLRRALGPHSRVLIHDHVLRGLSREQAEAEAASFGTVVAPEPLLPNFGVGNISMYQWDLTMWLVCNAKERTLQNILDLTTAAGLKLEKVWDLVETCVLELSVA